MVKAVIFDMDGVLVDSEIIYVKTFQQILEEYKIPCMQEDLYAIVGSSEERTIALLDQISNPILSGRELFDLVIRYHEEHPVDYASCIQKGVKETLQYLKEQKYKIGLASSSSKENILQVLGDCEIAEYFEVISSGYDFEESKPNPEIYITTMQKLGVCAKECVVLEDSYYGILAAKRAGIHTVAKRDIHFGIDQSSADDMIDHVDDLIQVVKRLEENA
ncbi:MAG: HAD family hydrolase [Breznakia sp.]